MIFCLMSAFPVFDITFWNGFLCHKIFKEKSLFSDQVNHCEWKTYSMKMNTIWLSVATGNHRGNWRGELWVISDMNSVCLFTSKLRWLLNRESRNYFFFSSVIISLLSSTLCTSVFFRLWILKTLSQMNVRLIDFSWYRSCLHLQNRNVYFPGSEECCERWHRCIRAQSRHIFSKNRVINIK